MTESERQGFLAAVRIGILGVERADRAPLLTPVWYAYAPGGDVVFNTEESAVKGRLLRAAGRASLSVQQEEFPYAYVTVEGTVRIEPATVDLRTEIASRYLGEEMGRAYVDSQPDADDITVVLTPQRWFTVDFAKLSADPPES
jgi:PPOX class probable F420-dependent enzyme